MFVYTDDYYDKLYEDQFREYPEPPERDAPDPEDYKDPEPEPVKICPELSKYELTELNDIF